MKDGDVDDGDTIVGWPRSHFSGHKRRFSEFDAPTFRAILALRSTAQRVENALGAWFLDDGLTPQKFGVLVVLLAEGKPISLSELRRFLGTTQANVTGLVAGLERDGLIERKTSRQDRRVSFVSLTRGGRRLVESTCPSYFAWNRGALRALSQSEKKTFVELLEKVSRGFANEDFEKA
jgi:DNA-binding MarR family transcriptional regulator